MSNADHARLADIIVNRSLQVSRGECVIVYGDPEFDPGIAAPLRAAITQAGGIVQDIVAPNIARDSQLSPAQLEERFAKWQQTFARCQAAIWLPSDLKAASDRPFERLVESSHVRSIHYHWFLTDDAKESAQLEQMYAAAIDVPPAVIGARIAVIEHALRGKRARITAPNGTDLTLTVPVEAWFHRNTGDASKRKVSDARSIRDREEELPASVLRTTDIRDASGTFVGHVSFDTRSPIVRATIANGIVTKLESVRDADEAVAAWNAATGNKAALGELVISTNTALRATLPSGFMPYYGYGAGIVRLAIGDNWESGGVNRSSNGELLMFLPNADLSANGRALIQNGNLVVSEQ
jgi:leucyl aminopeptidase (aminopeptidase T)